MDLPFFDDIITLNIMDVFSYHSILTRVRSKNPCEVWDAFISSWLGVFGAPKCFHVDKVGEWKIDLLRDLSAERRINLVFEDVGAHPGILARCYGLARGTRNLLKADGFFFGSVYSS